MHKWRLFIQSKKMIVTASLLLPLFSSPLFAKNAVIPKVLDDGPQTEKINSKQARYTFKNYLKINAKGTILSKISGNNDEKEPENWFNLSPIIDDIQGVSTEEAYTKYGLPKSQDIIIAVIDSGVDVNHEDLQGKIWINKNEIPNNNKDDDKNGYVDDVFGWNFIGGKNGSAKIVNDESVANGYRLIQGDPSAQIGKDSLEMTREFARLKAIKNPTEDEKIALLKVKNAYEHNSNLPKNAQDALNNLDVLIEQGGLKVKFDMFKGRVAKLDDIKNLISSNDNVLKAKEKVLKISNEWSELIEDASIVEGRFLGYIDYVNEQLKDQLNLNFNPRSIVGDDYSNIKERFYGNNDVIGPDADHGTHVSGIIAANRGNEIGIKGIASNVKIMAVRAVPDGDERDKDIANAIRYAVNNGARVINMSFGKGFSPGKSEVDLAVKYAEKNGVLLVHAAGNDNSNNDTHDNFPNRNNLFEKVEFTNWLEIGASTFKRGLNLPADFSNYGKRTVDFFAPGHNITSTTPNNTYNTFSGTSMAAPVVSGVAALVLSFNPALKADELKQLLQKSSRSELSNEEVNLPGTHTPVQFGSLSRFGSIVDSLNTLDNLKK